MSLVQFLGNEATQLRGHVVGRQGRAGQGGWRTDHLLLDSGREGRQQEGALREQPACMQEPGAGQIWNRGVVHGDRNTDEKCDCLGMMRMIATDATEDVIIGRSVMARASKAPTTTRACPSPGCHVPHPLFSQAILDVVQTPLEKLPASTRGTGSPLPPSPTRSSPARLKTA